MAAVGLDTVVEIKKAVADAFDGLYLHMHDTCAGVYFDFDEPQGDEVWSFVRDFFAGRGIEIAVSEDRTSCWPV